MLHAKKHWEKVYNTKAATDVSWFQPHAELSLKLIRNTGVAKTAAIIDVERQQYVHKVMQAVKPGGFVIVATFADDGPTTCSGLPVMRYSKDELHAEFGAPFQLLGHEYEAHQTPAGHIQKFVYCCFKKLN